MSAFGQLKEDITRYFQLQNKIKPSSLETHINYVSLSYVRRMLKMKERVVNHLSDDLGVIHLAKSWGGNYSISISIEETIKLIIVYHYWRNYGKSDNRISISSIHLINDDQLEHLLSTKPPFYDSDVSETSDNTLEALELGREKGIKEIAKNFRYNEDWLMFVRCEMEKFPGWKEPEA